jgi:hypothetical protein
MGEKNKVMTCIVGQTIRGIISQANELGIPREAIVNMFTLGGQIYLVYYKS